MKIKYIFTNICDTYLCFPGLAVIFVNGIFDESTGQTERHGIISYGGGGHSNPWETSDYYDNIHPIIIFTH